MTVRLPNDDAVLAAVAINPPQQTFRIKDRLEKTRPGLRTAAVLRRLNRLQQLGEVCRHSMSYDRVIFWDLTEKGRARLDAVGRTPAPSSPSTSSPEACP